jgi:hypothetical protein
VSQLTKLQLLGLAGTKMSGGLPEELYELTTLERLSVAGANFTGTISGSIGQLTALEHFLLENNNFTGGVPETIASLIRISKSIAADIAHSFRVDTHIFGFEEYLHLQGNNLGGEIPLAICERRLLPNSTLTELVVDCSVECQCCDLYECR